MSLPFFILPLLLTVLLILSAVLFFAGRQKKSAESVLLKSLESERLLKNKVRQLESQISKISSILNTLSEGVIGVNAGQDILFINPSAEATLQITQSTAIGKNLLQVAKDVRIDAIMNKAMAGQTQENAEISLSYPKEKVLRASAIGLSANPDSDLRGLLVFYDITDIRKLETLRQEFVANVSHELKTPLTSIKGFLETLLSGALKDASRSESFLQMMQEDTNRLTRLIDDLLELSSIESKKSFLKLKPVEIHPLLQDAAAMIQPKAEAKKIEIQIKTPPNLPKVSADPDKLKQILLNLLDNAIKFNQPQGKIEMTAKIQNKALMISIQDTGVGIASDAVDRVFERFFRADKSRTSDSGGTGLGLSIVKHLVEAQNGKVSCLSTPGKGSTFSFTLPLAS